MMELKSMEASIDEELTTARIYLMQALHNYYKDPVLMEAYIKSGKGYFIDAADKVRKFAKLRKDGPRYKKR